MLRGSVDQFAIPAVLSLLAGTRKTGELRVSDDAGNLAWVWIDDGCLVAAKAGAVTDAIDVLFAAVRMVSGSFVFSPDVAPTTVGERRDVAPLLDEVANRLAEWRTIQAVVPSLSCAVALATDLPGDDLFVNAIQWKALVAVADGGTVDAVAARLGLGEFGACKTVKRLVDADLVTIDRGAFDDSVTGDDSVNEVEDPTWADDLPAATDDLDRGGVQEPATRRALLEAFSTMHAPEPPSSGPKVTR